MFEKFLIKKKKESRRNCSFDLNGKFASSLCGEIVGWKEKFNIRKDVNVNGTLFLFVNRGVFLRDES